MTWIQLMETTFQKEEEEEDKKKERKKKKNPVKDRLADPWCSLRSLVSSVW